MLLRRIGAKAWAKGSHLCDGRGIWRKLDLVAQGEDVCQGEQGAGTILVLHHYRHPALHEGDGLDSVADWLCLLHGCWLPSLHFDGFHQYETIYVGFRFAGQQASL